MEKMDFLAIGDTVIDAFIKIKDAHVHCKIDTDACELCFRFGDKVPYEEVTVVPAVGNAANAAVAASRLGLKSALVTNIGDDRDGEECLTSLKKDKVDTSFVKVNTGIKTNYHYVLWYVPERTILIKHEKYEYSLPDIGEPKWLYFSSVSSTAFPFHNTIADYLENHKGVKLAFQPGKNEIKLGKEKLERLYKNAEIFFCNVEEAETILGKETKDVLELSKGISALGPKMVAISDGPNGAYLYLNNELWFMPIYPDPVPPFERTGAGDAFSSTFTAGLALGMSPLEALAWGPINSMAVVQEIGAQKGLLSREKLEEYLKNAPADYKPKKIVK
ncbi:carbohydrate kinase family protein [Candidatus Nomurabacteria bacterium]|nr:carbohydrate kinase family protein [Candidatus Nomurabacteria bacterium]